MSELALVVLAVTGLFFLFLGIKQFAARGLCAVCAAVSVTWIGLFLLRLQGTLIDSQLLALLVGESVVGGYYLTLRRLPERFTLFRLPLLLTLTAGGYYLVRPLPLDAVLVLGAVWLLFGLIWIFTAPERFQRLARKIIDCCRDF